VQHRQSWKTVATQIRQDGYDAAVGLLSVHAEQHSAALCIGHCLARRFTSGGFGPLLTHKSQWERSTRPYLDYPRDLLRLLFLILPSTVRSGLLPAATADIEAPGAAYVVFQTGAGSPIREWPEDRWIQLGRELTARGHLVALAGAGPREKERAARIAAALPPVRTCSISATNCLGMSSSI